MSSEMYTGVEAGVENQGEMTPGEVMQAEGQAALHALHEEAAKAAVTASVTIETDVTVDPFKDCTNHLDGLTIYATRQHLSTSDEERERNYLQWANFQKRLDASGHR